MLGSYQRGPLRVNREWCGCLISREFGNVFPFVPSSRHPFGDVSSDVLGGDPCAGPLDTAAEETRPTRGEREEIRCRVDVRGYLDAW